MLFKGDFLDGLEIARSPVFDGWLTAQRRRFRGCHAALLEHLVRAFPMTKPLVTSTSGSSLRRSTGVSHELLLGALARRGQIREAEEHLATTARLFEAEGLDCTPIREAWRHARTQTTPSRLSAAEQTPAAVTACVDSHTTHRD
jgi:DNA-binding SARP family transcriptional activator